tara:strand:- start:550 stop:672 length:123 start_codon:yes stop_codon:yes gene_type:complete
MWKGLIAVGDAKTLEKLILLKKNRKILNANKHFQYKNILS